MQPEQQLLHLSESEFYEELVRRRDRWTDRDGPHVQENDIPVAPVLDYNIQSTNYIGFPPEWCPKKREMVAKRFETCRTAAECSLFLCQELEKYELLQHQGQSLRRRRRKKRTDTNISSESDSESSSASADTTSDEESLRAQSDRQSRVVKRMEVRMRELMEQERLEWEKQREMHRPEDVSRWRKPGEYLEKEFNHRLRQVE